MKLSLHSARRSGIAAVLLSFIFLSNSVSFAQTSKAGTRKTSAAKPTVAEAQKFVAHAEQRLTELNLKVSRASWVQENFITDDTEALAAAANNELTAAVTELAEQATRFDKLKLPYDT